MNLKEIKEIISLMNDNNLGEIEIEREGLKLKLKKAALEAQFQAPVHYAVESIPTPRANGNSVTAPTAAEAKAEASQKLTKDI
ncbi:MAG: hypothetical protein WCH62_03990, partial [Candidatus Omnitrophota bacterium]